MPILVTVSVSNVTWQAQEGDQRQKILSGNQKLFEGSERLNETQRIAYESEAIGTQTIIDLKRQKDTLLRARDGVSNSALQSRK